MSKVTETSLIIKKETKFDKIRKTLFMMFFRKRISNATRNRRFMHT